MQQFKTVVDQSKSQIAITARDGRVLTLNFIADDICRVRYSDDGRYSRAWLLRYGFIKSDWPSVRFDVRNEKSFILISGRKIQVRVNPKTLAVEFMDAAGRRLLGEALRPESRVETGFKTRFHLPKRLSFFGLGDQTRERIEHRGTRATMWVRNLLSYIPVPLLLTDGGYAILVNTTRKHEFDLGVASKKTFGFDCRRGTVDYYFLSGATPAEQIERYTRLTGRPPLPPKWTFGLWFVCNKTCNAHEMLDNCLKFREKGIPCDAVGLEPGWMEKDYDLSVDKKFHPDKFYVLPWFYRAAQGNNVHNVDHVRSPEQLTFIDAARNLGFKPGLWLCQNYDLSYEAERRAKSERAADSGAADSDLPVEGDMEHDEHLAGAVITDKLTRPDEPWYQHLKKFVTAGIEYFKVDGCTQTMEHPDRLWHGNGMTDEEMHNLYPLLNSEQMCRGFRETTGRRAAFFTPNGWTGLQRFPGTWTGDTGGGPKPLVACLNLSMSGHCYMTSDMDNTRPEGIHAGFLLPWAQLCSWGYWKHPWFLKPEVQSVFRDYARLRYRLIPYLYSQAFTANQSGMPILRALPLSFPDDYDARNVLNEYMLGDNLLVTAFDRNIYIPAGNWTDFWTGKTVIGPRTMEYIPPSGKGGGLFVRAGAIIPMGPERDFVDSAPETEITLDIHPNAAGSAVYYEDDGASYDYERGRFASTSLQVAPSAGKISVLIGRRQGGYRNMPKQVNFTLQLHVDKPPRQVVHDGKLLAERPSGGQNRGAGWWFDPSARLLVIIPRSSHGEFTLDL